MKFENIPADLKALPHWVVWKAEKLENGRTTKIPYSAHTLRTCSVTDFSAYATYERSCEVAPIYSGIGFCFSHGPYAGVDLDGASISPDTRQWHEQLIQHFDSYTERSPSGQGYHILVKGSVPQGRRDTHKGIEIYSEARYFTVTGDVVLNRPIREVNLIPLWESLGGAQTQLHEPAVSLVDAYQVSDEDVLSQAGRALNQDKFKVLWSGAVDGHNNDHSAADQALMNILAYYSQDREQLKRLFRLSGLGQRKKAWRQDYLDRTIQKAFDQIVPAVNFKWESQTAKALTPAETRPSASEPRRKVSLAYPPGLVGDIAKFIYAQAPVPAHPIAIAGAIGLLAGITSRAYAVSNKGLNQYLVLLAKTGRGKEAMASGISKLMGMAAQQEPAAWGFIGPARVASGQAIIKHLDESPCHVSIIGEFGQFMAQLCSWRANEKERVLREVILDVYGKSGPSDVLRPLVYSDRSKNTKSLRSPGLTILGESTPSEFFESMDEASVRMGLLPRMLLIEYDGPRNEFNEDHSNVVPDPELIRKLTEVCSYALRLNAQSAHVPVVLDPQAIVMDREYRLYCDAQINSNQADVLLELWNRSHLKVLKLAALIAVGVSPFQPVVTADVYQWAAHLVDAGTSVASRRFESGETGTPVNATRQHAEVLKVLNHFFSNEFVSSTSLKINNQARMQGYVPLHYLNSRLRRNASFSRDRDAMQSISKVLQAMCDEGMLTKVSNKLQNGISSVYYLYSTPFQESLEPQNS